MTQKKGLGKGLGKGLDSLIVEKVNDEVALTKENVSRETFLNINLIEPNQTQPRKNFDEDSLQELADSIKLHGIIQPLIVQKKEEHYEIIAGERRWRAARLANIKEVPVIIKEYSEQEVVEIALIENLQREDLNPIEEANAYQRLISEYHLKQDEIAERVAKSRTAVTNSMRLLKLDSRIQQMLIDDMLTGGHARALLSIKEPEEQYLLATKIFDEKLSVRETEKLVKKYLSLEPKKKSEIKTENNIIYQNIEEKMKNIFGSKVVIKRRADDKGKIEIEYYSIDELERIIELVERIG